MNTTSQALKKTLLFFLCLAYTSHTVAGVSGRLVAGAYRIPERMMPQMLNRIARQGKRPFATAAPLSQETMQQAEVYKNSGIAYEKEGNIDEAIKCYLDQIEILGYWHPTLRTTYSKLAALLEQVGYTKEADACRILMERLSYMETYRALCATYGLSYKHIAAMYMVSSDPWPRSFFDVLFEDVNQEKRTWLFNHLAKAGIIQFQKTTSSHPEPFYSFNYQARVAILQWLEDDVYDGRLDELYQASIDWEKDLDRQMTVFLQQEVAKNHETDWLVPHKKRLSNLSKYRYDFS